VGQGQGGRCARSAVAPVATGAPPACCRSRRVRPGSASGPAAPAAPATGPGTAGSGCDGSRDPPDRSWRTWEQAYHRKIQASCARGRRPRSRSPSSRDRGGRGRPRAARPAVVLVGRTSGRVLGSRSLLRVPVRVEVVVLYSPAKKLAMIACAASTNCGTMSMDNAATGKNVVSCARKMHTGTVLRPYLRCSP